jgi:hypothetical protein
MPNEEKSEFSAWSVPDPRPDLAFPKLTEEMIERLRPFGLTIASLRIAESTMQRLRWSPYFAATMK